MIETFFDILKKRLLAAPEYNSSDQVKPHVILWPDKDKQWEALCPLIRKALPHFLALGAYDPVERTGPAIWLRCMVARALPDADWTEETVPIIYLPGVSRQELRAVDSCSRSLSPLAEMQYRGVIWSQKGGRDWTISAFLQSEDGGLGLDVASDNATREALLRSLLKLCDEPVAELKGRRIDGPFLDQLARPDITRDILKWLNNPQETRERWSVDAWGSFCSLCKKDYHFEPEADGVLVAGERLGTHDKGWVTVWRRFEEAPGNYPNIPDILRKARPKTPPGDMFSFDASWPQMNEEEEEELRKALSALEASPLKKARERILKLEEGHRERRKWVWAKLGWSPLALSLEHLAELARQTMHPLAGNSLEELAGNYAEEGWRADAAVLDALAHLEEIKDFNAVRVAIRAIYREWLENGAERLQDLLKAHPLPAPAVNEPAPGECILFVDGLRFDIGRKLMETLTGEGINVSCSHSLAALPTVTATAKPAVSPICAELIGEAGSADFSPSLKESGNVLSTHHFQKLLERKGLTILGVEETGDPSTGAWTECGGFDKAGHEQQWKLSRRISEELRTVVSRVKSLLEAGWREIRIVTDHGWLLIPGGLPKVDLPAYLAESRWGRCAMLKQSSSVEMLTMPWHWCPDVLIAFPPGIHSFFAGNEYAHGGLSPQECVIPCLTVTAAKAPKSDIQICAVKWVGHRCKVEVAGGIGLMVDIRTKANNAASTIVGKLKEIDEKGIASLVVPDEDLSGTAVFVVVIGQDGNPIAKMQTTVGGD